MSTRDHAPVGAPCWVDLQTSNPEHARAFYPALLGWEAGAASPEFGGYFMFTSGGVPVAGCMPSDAQAPVTDVWSVYLAVEDAAKSLQSAAEHGAQIVVHPMPVADLGTMGFLVDAGGAGVGVWQPGSFPGITVLGEPGAPGWFELLARDYASSVAFYRDVFGWRTQVMSDTPEFRYTLLVDADGGQLAGLMDAAGFLPAGAPPFWSVYWTVADTDAAVAQVAPHGGTVLEPATDTPYGRMATVSDPDGARFKIVGPNDAMPAR